MKDIWRGLNIGLIICLGIAVVLSCFGVLMPELPKGDDLIFHLARIESLSEGLRLGEFPVRIYPHYFKGYGYANGLMYPDLFLYPAAFLCLKGLDVVVAYKALILGCTFFTALFMYRALFKITAHEWASRLGMLLYTASLYRVVDVWTRAALGEVLAFMFIPFIVLGIYYIFFDDDSRWHELTIGFSGVFLSHLLSGGIWSGIMMVICLLCLPRLIKQPRRLWNLTKATMMSILLVSFFLFPMFEQLIAQKLKMSEDIAYYLGDSLLPMKEVFMLPFIEGHPKNWFPGGIGMPVIGIILLGCLVQYRATKLRQGCYSWLLTGISIFVLVMMCDFFPWYEVLKVLPVFESIQFIWRFLMVATAFLCVSYVVFYSHLTKWYTKGIGILIVVLALWTGISAQLSTLYEVEKVNSSILMREEISEYAVNDRNYQVGNAEYVPLKTNIPVMYGLENRYRVNQAIDYTFSQSGTTIELNFSNQTEPYLKVEVPLLYYKGYGAKLITDSGETSLQVMSGTNGAVRVIIPDMVGEGKIVISYEGTIIQHVTFVVSSLGLVGFVIILIQSKLKRNRLSDKKESLL